MFRTLVKADTVTALDRQYAVRYFELRTPRGARRYSAEIVVDADDRIILDDDSVMRLQAKAARMAPVMIYSRMLARTA